MTFTWDESIMNLFYDMYRYEKKRLQLGKKILKLFDPFWTILFEFEQVCSNLIQF